MKSPALTALLAAMISACAPAQPPGDVPSASTPGAASPSGTAPLKVAVSTGALAYCTRAIGGDRVEVMPLVKGVDGVPTREALLKAQEADLILLNGAGHEPWLPAVTLPADALLDTSGGAPEIPEDPHGRQHRHGPEGAAHGHGRPSLVWLDPRVVGHQCERTHQALAKRLPAERNGLAERHQRVQLELGALDEALAAASRPLRNTAMVAAGSGYRSFARRYGLPMRFTRHRPESAAGAGSSPSTGTSIHGSDADVLFLQELDQLAAAEPVRVVVLPREPSDELGEKISKRGLALVVLDPLSDWTSSERGFIAGQRRNLQALRSSSADS
jgi:ABC-type Zn uptake system ZnuABC Zn-binding protein ZnuA